MLVMRAGSLKMLVRISNREDPDQTASSEAVWSGSALFVFFFDQNASSEVVWSGSALFVNAFLEGTSVQNFRTITILYVYPKYLAGLQIRVYYKMYWKLFFLFLNQNICCGYSKELSDGSFEEPKHR